MIYPEQRGDYLPKSWNTAAFNAQFDILMDAEAFIAATEEGFVRLSLFEKIGEVVKSFLGGTDHSQTHRIQAAWLKFLYYGEAHGLLQTGQIERLSYRMTYLGNDFDPAIERLFQELRNHHQFPAESKSEHLSHLRMIVDDYHQRHVSVLRPGLWSRLFISPALDTQKLILFGDTPLYLSHKALKFQKPDPYLALMYLQKAFDLKNDSPEFQEKLAEQLQKLEDAHLSELEGQKRKMQEHWIELGKIAFKNGLPDLAQTYLLRAVQIDPKNTFIRLQVGKVYLVNQEYALAQPFLADLRKSFPHDFSLQIEIGHAHWQADQFKEATEVYEATLNHYRQHKEGLGAHQKTAASIYNRMGIAHLKKHIPNGNLTDALACFSTAAQTEPTVLEYQENLYAAYEQQWQTLSGNFAATHGQEWLKFLSMLDTSLVQKNDEQLISLLLECSEQFFNAHQNQKAHACLKTALTLFKDDAEVKVEALNLAIQHGDWAPLESKFDEWEREHYTDPYLKEKIGDAYWTSNKSEAVQAYLESLDLFEQQLVLCKNDVERTDCQQRMADIQARIGQTHLQVKPGIFTGIPYDAAIQHLEKAATLNPHLYSSALFDAYLAAAQAEKQRTKLLRDHKKVLAHYQKAFETLSQKGEYLIELLELCLHYKNDTEVVDLYYKIQKQQWSEEFALPSKILSKLAKKLFERKDYQASLQCLKQAYQQEPANQRYKQDYFQFSLTLAKDDYTKVQNKEEKDSIERLSAMAQMLETCWDHGFDNVQNLKPSFQEQLAQIYGSLAARYVKSCWLPRLAGEMDKKEIGKHQQLHEKEIQQALDYYDKALSYQPENAALHFDKGMLLDWQADYEAAFAELQLAVKYQPNNAFYHKILAPLYFVLHCDSENKEKHDTLAEECATPNFAEDYAIWKNEFMSQVKTKRIDPHAYVKKGWFS